MSRIDFKQIHKQYAPDLPFTIKDADLVIDKGEFCVFVGPSGCGKSTLLRMVAGLEDISSGELQIDGQRVNELPPSDRGVAMVFQSYALYPHMTVAQNMAFGLKVKKTPKHEIEPKVKEAARILQLTPLLDRLPKALSGGQRQRVAIGRAIVTEPKVFLFDEPLSNLDASLRVQTRLEIAKLHEDIGTASMIYVTHDQVEAMTLADKIVLLRAGKAVQDEGSVAQIGTPMALYHRPASMFVAEFIGSPKMNMLEGRFLRGEGDHAVIDLNGQEVNVAADARHVAAGASVKLGVRPEDLPVGDDGAGTGIRVMVRHVERLGDISLLYVDYGNAPTVLTVRVEGSVKPAAGHGLTLRLLPERLHLFDGSGKACQRTIELPT
jgi:multiple sugar transport system ATP-binding protein